MGFSSSGAFGEVASNNEEQSLANEASTTFGLASPIRLPITICLAVSPCQMETRQPTLLSTAREGGYASFTSVDGREGVPVCFVTSPFPDQRRIKTNSTIQGRTHANGTRDYRKETQRFAKRELASFGETASLVSNSKFPDKKESDFVGHMTVHPSPRPLPLGRGEGVVGGSTHLGGLF